MTDKQLNYAREALLASEKLHDLKEIEDKIRIGIWETVRDSNLSGWEFRREDSSIVRGVRGLEVLREVREIVKFRQWTAQQMVKGYETGNWDDA